MPIHVKKMGSRYPTRLPERLHGYVDAGVEEYEAEQTEPHGHVETQEDPRREMERAGVGKEYHHQHGDDCAHQKIWLAAAHAGPCAVRPLSDEGLDYHAHQRGKDPEEAELVGIRPECCEYAAYVGALERISYLDAEEPEAQVPHVPKRQFSLVSHWLVVFC